MGGHCAPQICLRVYYVQQRKYMNRCWSVQRGSLHEISWNNGSETLGGSHHCLCSSSSPSAAISWFHDKLYFTLPDKCKLKLITTHCDWEKYFAQLYEYQENFVATEGWNITLNAAASEGICCYQIWDWIILDVLKFSMNIRVKNFVLTTLFQILLVQNSWYNINCALNWKVILNGQSIYSKIISK